MTSYQTTRERIEEEYQRFRGEPSVGMEQLYGLLFPYLRKIVSVTMREGFYADGDTVEDVVQDVLVGIFQGGMEQYEEQGAGFAAWCARVAKNRALDKLRKMYRRREDFTEESGLDQYGADGSIWENSGYLSGEEKVLRMERQLMICRLVKRYLKLFVEQDEKPYRMVSCGYTLILFHRHHPRAKELSSPGWAYGVLEKETVEFGAIDFIRQMGQWMPWLELLWGLPFMEKLSLKEDEAVICEMVFGERFQVKDFENWSRRMRDKIKAKLIEEQAQSDCGWEL